MCTKGRSYHRGSHEHLRLLGYDSDDDINMCHASKPLSIISSTPPNMVYKILLGVAWTSGPSHFICNFVSLQRKLSTKTCMDLELRQVASGVPARGAIAC